MNNSRIVDGGLVAAGAAQATLADFPNLLWEDIASHPIQAMVGIATIFLIIARTVRMVQKIRRKSHEQVRVS